MTADSVSTRRSAFDDCVGDATDAEAICSALDGIASSSRKTTGSSIGWTSSEDEADAMEQDDEGSILSNFLQKNIFCPQNSFL